MAISPNGLLALLLAISALSYFFEQILEWINLRALRTEIPTELEAFYDRERYLKSLSYHKELTRFGFLSSAFSFLLSIAMLAFGVFGWLDSQLMTMIEHEIGRALVFFAILLIASDILTLPFVLYSTFVIEQRYGFNKTTLRIFFIDKLKGYLLALLIGAPLLSVLLYLILYFGSGFWILFSVVAAAFVLFLNMFYTSLILPLFNKLTPLPDGALKEAIHSLAAKVDFPLDQIYVIDGSKRSSKANAFFSGLGRKKKIVLYDTLIEKHTSEELIAVLAHEVGHFKKKHIVRGMIFSILQIVFTLWILSLMVYNEQLSLALGAESLSLPVNLIAFTILFSPISGVTGLLMMIESRKNEFEADAYAKKVFDGIALGNALKRLSVDSLSNLFPHPLYVFFHYSHPPLLARLKALSN